MRIVAVGTLIAATLVAASPASAAEWVGELGLYGWLAGLDGTVGVGTEQVDVNRLAEFTNFTVAIHGEGRSPRWSFIGDVFFVSWDAESDSTESGAMGERVTTSLETDQWVFEGGAGFRLLEPLEVIAAGRIYSLNARLRKNTVTTSERTRTWADVYAGARYREVFADKWIVAARADVGTGGSDLALFGNALAGYRFGGGFSVGAIYRVLSLDYEADSGEDRFQWDVVQNGFGIFLGNSY